MKRFMLLSTLVILVWAILPAQENHWQEAAPGVWLLKVGQEQSISLLGSAGIAPNLPALKKLPDPAFPLDKDKIRAEVIDGKSYLRFPLERGEELRPYRLLTPKKQHHSR